VSGPQTRGRVEANFKSDSRHSVGRERQVSLFYVPPAPALPDSAGFQDSPQQNARSHQEKGDQREVPGKRHRAVACERPERDDQTGDQAQTRHLERRLGGIHKLVRRVVRRISFHGDVSAAHSLLQESPPRAARICEHAGPCMWYLPCRANRDRSFRPGSLIH